MLSEYSVMLHLHRDTVNIAKFAELLLDEVSHNFGKTFSWKEITIFVYFTVKNNTRPRMVEIQKQISNRHFCF